jgi:hypothetical protein
MMTCRSDDCPRLCCVSRAIVLKTAVMTMAVFLCLRVGKNAEKAQVLSTGLDKQKSRR